MRSLRPIRFLCVAVLLLAAPARAQDGPPAAYHFSPVNQYGIQLTAAYWNPIIAYVSEKSGVRLTLKIGRTSADTTAYVLAREVEFVFSNHLFSPERESLGWKVFGRRNTPPVRGQLVVPEGSPLAKVAELAGKPVGFPGPEALVAYKFPYAYILQQKIDVQVVFGGNMDAALVQMYAGKVAAVGGNSQLIEGFARREGRKYTVLWSSEPVHDLALMASSKVPAADVAAVGRGFFGMAKDPRGREVLHAASKEVGLGADASFIPSDGSEYDAYRMFYRTAPAQLR